MRTAIFTTIFVAFTFLTTNGQTKVTSNFVQPYPITGTIVSFKTTSPAIGTLQSSIRTLQLYQTEYMLPAQGGGSYSSILIKEKGIFKAFRYHTFGPVDSFEIKQLNGTGLPELILYTYSQMGNAYYSQMTKHQVVFDFDLNKVIWDLASSYNYTVENKEATCSQTITFSNGSIEVGQTYGNKCDINTEDAGDEYSILPIGTYTYKNGSYNLPVRTSEEVFKSFWADFKSATITDNKAKVSEMTSLAFYDGDMSSYKNKANFLSTYQYIIDDDAKFMIKNARFGEEVVAPKRQNQQDITYQDGAKISLTEVTDQSTLATYRTKFKLGATAKVYILNYSYDRIMQGSSHPYQSGSTTFYFGQTTGGFKFCGKGMVY